MRVSNATWVWSDTHFGHPNIVKYQQRPVNHEVIMLSNWIERVREDDTILHLGDVMLGRQGNPKRWAKVLARMPGRKFALLGNHDADPALLESAGFTLVDPFIWEKRGVAFTHRPITHAFPGLPEDDLAGQRSTPLLVGWDTNVHGHIHANQLVFSRVDRYADEGAPLPNRRYVNVCVEATNLAPVQLGNLL